MKTRNLLASIVFTLNTLNYIGAWSQRIHSAVFELAIESLPDHIKEDLRARSFYFNDINLAENISVMAALPDILRHGLNLHLLDDYHYSVVFYKDISDNSLNLNERNHLYRILSTLQRHLTRYSKMRSDFFDTFSMIFSAHLIVELFQPLHTILEDGLQVHVKRNLNLHTYWDGGCTRFRKTKIPGIVKHLKEVQESGSFSLNGKDIEIDLTNPFESYDADYMVKRLRDVYAKVDRNHGDGTQIVHDLIIDKQFIHSSDYKEFCLRVTLPNLLNATTALRLFLIDVYKNLETKLKEKKESYYDVRRSVSERKNRLESGMLDRSNGKGYVNAPFIFITIQSMVILFLVMRNRASE